MHAAVAQHREAIEELCRRYGVTKLDVFGSATRDDFDEARSDVDFLVEFSYDVPGMGALRQYFGFKEDLEKLLGRVVDLVSPEALRNPFLRAGVDESREAVYAA